MFLVRRPKGIYPIGFSIPACKVVEEVPPKTREVSPLIPGDLSTYVYDTEEEYYQQYRESRTAHTWKKAGWDCMRHYEILANGCIPLFRDLDKCPPMTMTFYPKQGGTVEELLEHTRKYLTTRAMAQYVLDTVGVPNPKRVLYLAPHPWADYLRDLTLHGLKEILGTNCHEYPRVPFL